MASARLGRTNFAKCIVPTDPPILQHFKQLSNLRPMNVLAKSSASDASGFQLNQAVIIRKGRSTFQTVTKDYKEKIEAAMNQFKTNLSGQTDPRSANFGRSSSSSNIVQHQRPLIKDYFYLLSHVVSHVNPIR